MPSKSKIKGVLHIGLGNVWKKCTHLPVLEVVAVGVAYRALSSFFYFFIFLIGFPSLHVSVTKQNCRLCQLKR